MGRLIAGDLRTGLILVKNIPSEPSASVVLNQAGTITAKLTLPLIDPDTGVKIDLRNLIGPTKSFIAYEDQGRVINAGPLWSEVWDRDNATLTWSAAGLRSYWQHRFVLPALAGGETPSGNDTALGPLSLRTIAKRLIQQAQTVTGGSVPVDLESDVAGSAERNYLGSDLGVLDERLAQLTGVIGGPDIMFNPYITEEGTHVRWAMQTGNPMITQAGPDHRWDTTVPSPSVQGTKITRSGAGIITEQFVSGDQIEARAVDDTLVTAGFPVMQASTSRSSVTDPATLQDYADAGVALGGFYTETITFNANKNVAPGLLDVSVGDFGTLVIDDPWIGQGQPRVRILSITAREGDDFLAYACAPDRTPV